MIVDTHVHVVADDQKKYPLQPPPASALAPRSRETPITTIEQVLQQMDEAGVDRVVLAQPISVYSYDNSYAADSAKRYPERCASVGVVDMLSSDAADRLSYWVRERGMSGLRIMTGGKELGTWLDDPRTYPVWEQAASLHIPVCIMMYPNHVPRLRRLLERFPTVPVALDHLCYTFLGGAPPEESAEKLFDLVEYPNLYLKFSMMNLGTPSKWPAATHEFFRRVLDRFGVRRLMWGSNYPATHDRPYKEMLDITRQALSFLPAEDEKWLLGETALSLWPALHGK